MTVQVAPTVRVRRSTAAQRAYERRQQRSTFVGGPVAVSTSTTEISAREIVARIPFVATIIGILCLGLAATLLLTTRAAEDSYELADARAHNQSLREQTAALQRDVAAGNSAPVLAVKAAEQGLIPAIDPARLLMDSDGAVHVIGTPKPAEGRPLAPLDRAPAPAPAPARDDRDDARTSVPTPSAPTTVPAPPAAREGDATPRSGDAGRSESRGEQSTLVTVITQPPAGARQ